MRTGHCLDCRTFTLLFIILSVSFCMNAPAWAEDEYNVYAHVESFTWKEFDGTNQLLKESGPLFGVGFTYRGDIGGDESALTLTPRAEIFGGSVNYDGQTQGGVPVQSDTAYFGAKLEFDIGGRFGSGFLFEPFAGLGIREWWRDINDTVAYDPTDGSVYLVKGYTENWTMLYGRLGFRGDVLFSKDSKIFFEVAGRIPIYNENTALLSNVSVFYEDVTLKPGKVGTLFAELGAKFSVFKMSVFYEALRFSESKIEWTTDVFGDLNGWVQPRSEADLIGFRIGASF